MANRHYSKDQQRAICHVDGSMMVLAGPGSGKTTVITERIKYLIESAGVSPADILVITYTKAAALEMESRFKALTKGKFYRVRFGTFHSIFFWIIKTAYHLDNSCVLLENERYQIAESIFRGLNLQYDNKEDVIASALEQISLVKCNMISIDNYYSHDLPANVFQEIYHRMEDIKRRNKKIDFDDMMVNCYELLKSRADILEQCRNIFRYILVDEFQDCNLLQYEIFKLLAKPRDQVFVVGDDDQSVYGFRGARPEIMQQFLKDFPECKQIVLGVNYRCAKNIVEASAKVIEKNHNRFEKKLVADSKQDGELSIYNCDNNDKENDKIVELIRRDYELGVPYENQAVLYRTNIQPRRLIYKLNSYNIPFSVSDTLPNLFEHFVVRNMLDYLKVAMGDRDRRTILRIINKPSRYINRDVFKSETVDFDDIRYRLRDKSYAEENLDKLLADLKTIKKLKPYPALNFIRKFVGYDDYLKEYSEYRQLDVTEFYERLDEFSNMISDMESFGEVFEFAEQYGEILKKQQGIRDHKGVQLMTMHSSKGLEFECVHIMDVVEGITPYKKAKTRQELEEERRMFYVAMTRAKRNLYLHVPRMTSGKEKEPSKYLFDVQSVI